ncbi:hypothetical protein DE146DRAFT_791928 [Phaeosphaeria sp. MPI-PUGE-AT-0046c]|nr:hypothetical protein DE146DRAFT_791928 [Phaeosphaeria sp. MPI-PUGE-AT-0046c]
MLGCGTQPLDIIIVGAGIAGLTTALGLAKEGHRVRIFEKSRFANEVGAALSLPSNLKGPLRRLGIEPLDFGANRQSHVVQYTKEGNQIFEQDLSHTTASLIHRVDLHEALKQVVIDQGVEIHLSSHITSVDTEKASISLSTGEVATAHAIIGADGIRSAVREHILPSAPKPTLFQRSMFRALIPSDKLSESPDTRDFLSPPRRLTVYESDDGRRIVVYPCRSNTIMNVSALFPTSQARTYTSTVEVKDHMLETYADFALPLRLLLATAEEPSPWTLYDLPALSTWSRGRAALIGDAAHYQTPYSGQGAAQAIEDAVTLTVLLKRGTRAEEVQDRLALFFAIRHERTEYIQNFARISDGWTPGVDKPGAAEIPSLREALEVMYNHDACAYAEQRLCEHLDE